MLLEMSRKHSVYEKKFVSKKISQNQCKLFRALDGLNNKSLFEDNFYFLIKLSKLTLVLTLKFHYIDNQYGETQPISIHIRSYHKVYLMTVLLFI